MTYQGINEKEHKRILKTLLIAISKRLSSKIAFKGGTAAMMFYDLPRLSLDLDFDILKDFNKKDKEDIELIVSKYGEVRKKQDKRYTLFYLFDYEEGKPNIKLEFNRRIWKNNSYQDKHLMGVNMKIQDESTMLSNKLVALIDRKTPAARDLFDIYYFLTMEFDLNKDLIKERTSLEFDDFIKKSIKHIDENFNERNILQGLGELVDESQKDWVKSSLIKETKNLLNKLK